jgi:hypothetical protein
MEGLKSSKSLSRRFVMMENGVEGERYDSKLKI